MTSGNRRLLAFGLGAVVILITAVVGTVLLSGAQPSTSTDGMDH